MIEVQRGKAIHSGKMILIPGLPDIPWHKIRKRSLRIHYKWKIHGSQLQRKI